MPNIRGGSVAATLPLHDLYLSNYIDATSVCENRIWAIFKVKWTSYQGQERWLTQTFPRCNNQNRAKVH